MKHSHENRQPKYRWRRFVAMILALSMLLIPVYFPSAADAVEGATVVNEFTDEFTTDLSETRTTSPWEQGYTWVRNEDSANFGVSEGRLSITFDTTPTKPSFAYISAPASAGGADAAATMTDYTIETSFTRKKLEGTEDTAGAVRPYVVFRLQKTDLGYTGYVFTVTGNYNSATVLGIVRKLVPVSENAYNFKAVTPVGETSSSFKIQNPTTGECPVKIELDGNAFTLSYVDHQGNPAQKTYLDENVGDVGPYLSGSVGIGADSKTGTVEYGSFKLTLPKTTPPANQTNELTDEFTTDLSETRTTSPWEQGYAWTRNEDSANLGVSDGKLAITFDTTPTKPSFAYISAPAGAGGADAAAAMTDYTLETSFTREKLEGTEDTAGAVRPYVVFRLQKTDLGYTGYVFTVTGNYNSATVLGIVRKLVPVSENAYNFKAVTPVGETSSSFKIQNPTTGECPVKIELDGNAFTLSYVDHQGNPAQKTYLDENVGDVGPYLSGSVGIGADSKTGTVKYESLKLTLPDANPPANQTNKFTDEFTAGLSETRTTSPWEQGYKWGSYAKDGDLTVADGQLVVNYGSGSQNPSFAYITAPDANGIDAAVAMEDYEFEVRFARFAPDGVTEGDAVTPRVYFRLSNTPLGYTGYYLTVTGTNVKGGGTVSLNKMTPTEDNPTASKMIQPYWSTSVQMGSAVTIKVVAKGNVFEIYYDGDLRGTFVDENIGDVDPYLTGTVAVGAATNNGTVKYDYVGISLNQKTDDEFKFKNYSFTTSIDQFADLWKMDAALDIVDNKLNNTSEAAAKAVLKSSQALTDYAVDANVTLPSQGGISVLGRYTDANNSFYELTFNKTDGLVLKKAVNGTKTVLKTATPAEIYAKGLMILADGTYQLKLQMYGNTIEGWINDQVILSYEDTTAIASGVGGLILDPGAKVEYLEIAKVNAIVAITLMEDTNKNGNDVKLGDYLKAFVDAIEVPVGRTPDIKHLYLKAEFFNGDVKYIPVDMVQVEDFHVDSLGENTATVSYLNKTAELKYKVIDRSATIAQMVQDINALNLTALTIDDKAAVYALEDIYNDLTPAEKATVDVAVKEKLVAASEKIEFLVYPELAGTQIVFRDDFDTLASAKLYNSSTGFTGDRNDGYWSIENGTLVQYSPDDSVRTGTLLASARLENRNFVVTSISVDVQIIDRDVWVGLDFHANIGERYRFYICDKANMYNSETKKYGNRIDLNKNGTRMIREWKYEDLWQPGEWINLRATYIDGVVRCYIDDVLWIEYEDTTNPLSSGSVGLVSAEGWTKFDNLVVRGVDLSAEGTADKYNTNLEPKDYFDDFNDETDGQSPSHWIEDNREDNWKVKLDGTNLVYGNENGKTDNYSHSWLHVFDQDVDYAAKIKVTEIGDYPLVGLTARYNYDESYIKAGYDFTRQQWFIKVRYGYDFEETVAYSADGAPLMEVGTWYDLRLNVVGEKLELYIGDSTTPVVTADAGRKVMTGRVGVFTERCNVVIDDVDLTLVSGQSHVQDGVLEYTLDYTIVSSNFRYPSLIELPDGRVLLYQNNMRLVSSDDGQTFEVTTEFENINILGSHVLMHDGTYLAVAKERVYRSVDGCKTWTRLNDLPLDSNYGYAHTGDRLCEVKLDDGTYRLFVTVDAKYNGVVGGVERTTISEIYYSDDGGESWTVSKNNAATTTNMLRYAETNVIRATDGTLVQYCSYNPSDCMRYSISYDNGATWEGDYALPQIPGGVVSFCVKEDPYAPGTYYMVTVYNFAVSYNNGYPRHRISLFKSTDGYNWDFLCDVDRWGDISDGGRHDIMQNVNMYMTITEDYVFPTFARAERYSAENAHNIQFGRIYRFDKTKLEVQEFPQEYIIDGKHITYIEGIEEQITQNSDYIANKNFVVHYYDGSSDEIALSQAMVTGVDTSTLGKQTVTIDYNDFRAIYEVEVVNSGDNSDTGDNAAIVLFGSLMALSVLAAAVLLIPDIRKKLMK